MAVAALAARHLCHAPQSREAYRHHSEGRSGRRRARCGSRHPPREGHLAPTSQEGAWRAQSPPQEAALTLNRAPAKTLGNFPVYGPNTDSNAKAVDTGGTFCLGALDLPTLSRRHTSGLSRTPWAPTL